MKLREQERRVTEGQARHPLDPTGQVLFGRRHLHGIAHCPFPDFINGGPSNVSSAATSAGYFLFVSISRKNSVLSVGSRNNIGSSSATSSTSKMSSWGALSDAISRA